MRGSPAHIHHCTSSKNMRLQELFSERFFFSFIITLKAGANPQNLEGDLQIWFQFLPATEISTWKGEEIQVFYNIPQMLRSSLR